MALEIELKYLDADLDVLRARLGEKGAGFMGRHYEFNRVFDDADRTLRSRSVLLRLRRRRGPGRDDALLTVKSPSLEKTSSRAKVYVESETVVDNADGMAEALEVLGYRPAFAYEKVREKWSLMGCAVCLDRLPFGDFVEIEGPEDDILACESALGLDPGKRSRETYHALNLAHRERNGLPGNENFLFSDKERENIERELVAK